MTQAPKSNGPDPAVLDAIHRLNRTELSPLEEAMFQSWSTANSVEEGDDASSGVDLRGIYKETGGKVLPPNQLKRHVEKSTDIQTLMKAQEAHDASSPIKAMMEAHKGGMGSSGYDPGAAAPQSGGMMSSGDAFETNGTV